MGLENVGVNRKGQKKHQCAVTTNTKCFYWTTIFSNPGRLGRLIPETDHSLLGDGTRRTHSRSVLSSDGRGLTLAWRGARRSRCSICSEEIFITAADCGSSACRCWKALTCGGVHLGPCSDHDGAHMIVVVVVGWFRCVDKFDGFFKKYFIIKTLFKWLDFVVFPLFRDLFYSYWSSEHSIKVNLFWILNCSAVLIQIRTCPWLSQIRFMISLTSSLIR